MDDIAELAAAIDREKLERAKRMTRAERFLAGGELFDEACEISRSGIRHRHPDFTQDQVEAELRRRIEIGRRTEQKIAP